MKQNETNIVIVAGGDIRNKFNYIQSYSSCPALIPINSKPCITYILDFYNTHAPEARIYVIIDRNNNEKIDLELQSITEIARATLIPINSQESVIQTLNVGLKQIPFSEKTIVNLVTSIPLSLVKKYECIVDNQQSKNINWSILSKDQPKYKEDAKKYIGNAFTGIFNLPTDDLVKQLELNITKNDLLFILDPFICSKKLTILKEAWVDCGHEENFFRAKKQLINSRSFNELNVSNNGVIYKYSSNQKKLQQELYFAKNIPDELKYFLPRTEIIRKDNKNVLAMEFYGYPNVSELSLFWDLKNYVWENFFDGIKSLLMNFSQYSCSNIPSSSINNFYLNKTERRIEELKKQTKNPIWIIEEVQVNGLKILPYSTITEYVKNRIGNLVNQGHMQIMHGDLCFNNILYDFSNDIIKIIDARGNFEGVNNTIFGDIKYDLAKLMHSATYGYDYIVNDLYYFNENNGVIDYGFHFRPNQKKISFLMDELISFFKIEREDIVFIVGLLFISMASLHPENKTRQKLMYLHGMYIINKQINTNEKNLH